MALMIEAARKYDEQIGKVLSSLPEKLLSPPDKDSVERVPASALKFYKNVAGIAPAQQRKLESKRAKRLKYDLDARESKAAREVEPFQLLKSSEASLDDLKQKLQQKLDDARRARKRDAASDSKIQHRSKRLKKTSLEKRGAQAQEVGEMSTKDVSFPVVQPPSKRTMSASRKGAPGSKTRRLKSIAAEAQRKRTEMQRLKEAGDDTAEEMEWREAIQLASGELKARVDPVKIKKALKARNKKKEKSKREWQARLAHLKQQMELPKSEKKRIAPKIRHTKSTAAKRQSKVDSSSNDRD